MSKIIGGGYYGMMNYGDDLFGIVSSLAAKEFWVEDEFRLLCPPIKGFDANYAVPKWFPKQAYASLNAVGKASRVAFLLNGLSRADRYVFCGGSVFSSSASGARDIVTRFNRRGVSLAAVGVSIGPFSDTESERAIRSMLQRFDYISTRDKASYQIAKSFGLECSLVMAGDLAGLMPRYYPVLNDSKGKPESRVIKKIAFSPCNLGEDPTKASGYCDAFVKAVRAVASENPIEIILLNLNAHPVLGDRSLCEYTHKRLIHYCNIKARILNYSDLGVLGMWGEISDLDFYVSVRLHGAISAFLLGIPFCLFEYHPKCSEFLDGLKVQSAMRLIDEGSNLNEIILQQLERGGAPSDSVFRHVEAAILNFSNAPWL